MTDLYCSSCRSTRICRPESSSDVNLISGSERRAPAPRQLFISPSESLRLYTESSYSLSSLQEYPLFKQSKRKSLKLQCMRIEESLCEKCPTWAISATSLIASTEYLLIADSQDFVLNELEKDFDSGFVRSTLFLIYSPIIVQKLT